ncbi:reverse transcriptase domain-containing protein [Tanacetum coccineum]
MTGVPRHMAEHRLNVREGCPPVRQKKRGQAPERNKAIQEEVEKLVDAEIMKEVHYHSWLSNPVMVKKHDGSWRMCVDFKDLNKACPQDGYPLSEIDWKVESLCGYPFKCFLDAYKGYHQIKIAEEDEEKTAFITSQWIFCYTKMPFGLKNVGATYQRLVDRAFQKQIGRRDVLGLQSKRRRTESMSRQGRRHLKNHYFFKPWRNAKRKVISNGLGSRSRHSNSEETHCGTPLMTAPKEKEELIMYLAATKEAISAVLMAERGGKQLPVYFVSRALRGPEINYTPMEKVVLALLSASIRLKRYFQAHTIVVITNQPIKQLLSKSEISGRMLKSKFELKGYDIQYRPRTSIKGQILADFIIERPDEESPDELMAEPEELPEPWTLFTDGFEATNNEAEYEALIAGLRIAEQIGIKNLQANVDSRLVANQPPPPHHLHHHHLITHVTITPPSSPSPPPHHPPPRHHAPRPKPPPQGCDGLINNTMAAFVSYKPPTRVRSVMGSQTLRVRPGWVCKKKGTWVRGSTIGAAYLYQQPKGCVGLVVINH